MASDGARVQDFVNIVKDGVLLCNLLNRLNPETLELRDFSQRPHLSQFLCQKNVNVFLQKCSSTFKVNDEDLFEFSDLAHLDNFGKVLHTLSVLSQTPLAKKSKIESFSLAGRAEPFSKWETDIDAESVKSWKEDMSDDEGYGPSICSSAASLSIYEDLCSFEQTIKKRKKAASDPQTCSIPPVMQDLKTKTRRDFCIEEIVETEKNYVEALEMINSKFMKPLKECRDILSPDNCDKIFMGNEKLLSIHREFLELLKRASNRRADGSLLTIPDCFITFKEKFLFYGEFCSNLTNSQELLFRLCQESDSLQMKIKECQKNANEGKFKLHDLLAIPMQRVLKYHLLISELMKNTEDHHPEKKSLEKALDEMQDLSLFVNEVRRDHEMLNAIDLLRQSITGLPVNIVLRECGKLLMDGEMKVRLVSESTAHTRHLFLFDKRVIICKHAKNDVYTYKTSLLLCTYKLDDARDKSSFQLQEISGNAYLITAKNSEVRNKWRTGILLAQDNICPQHAQNKKNDFQMTTFNRPTICDVCRKFLRGIFFQGYCCQKTRIVAHKECLEKASGMEGPPTPLPPRSKEKAVAIKSYNGTPSPPTGRTALKFNKDDVIDVIGSGSDPSWTEGEFNGGRGEFPKSYVKLMPSRKPSFGPLTKIQDIDYVNKPLTDDDISMQPWYAGELTREQANAMLEKLQKGTYMVRKGAGKKDEYVISIQCDGVKHIKIGKSCTGGKEFYFLVSVKTFHSIIELVDWHSQNSLEKLFPEVKTPLTIPYRNAVAGQQLTGSTNDRNKKFCVAKFDYAATAPNHLSVKRGDLIEIVNKTGDERGWWKGLLNNKTGYFPKSYVKECEF